MNRPLLLALAAALLAVLAALLLWRAPAHEGAPPPIATPTPPPAARDLGAVATTTPPPPRDARVPSKHATVVLAAPWGSGPGQLGHRRDPESASVGPMSFLVDRRGVVVLDNVNARVARFDAHGKPLPPIALGSEAAQDLARGTRDRLAVLDRLRDKDVTLFDADGRALGRVPLAGRGVDEPAAVTGLFADRDGDFFIERAHGAWLELADADGHAVAARPSAPGRPMRDGRFVAAALVDRAAGTARVRVFGAASDATPAWDETVAFGAPVLFLALLDGDAAGNVYIGAHVGHEAPKPPYRIDDESLTLVALSPSGDERARLTVPAPPPAEESFRDLYVGDDGTIYWMRRTAAGVVVEAYRL